MWHLEWSHQLDGQTSISILSLLASVPDFLAVKVGGAALVRILLCLVPLPLQHSSCNALVDGIGFQCYAGRPLSADIASKVHAA
jgi:hypothetical protein